MRAFSVLLAAAALGAIAAPAAWADGLPVLGIDVGGQGVAAGPDRFVTVTLARETVVGRVAQKGGKLEEWLRVPGRFTIPAVAYDGSAAGISGDRRTLVLVRPRVAFPQRTTRLAILSAYSLRLREVLELDGDFSFDAISPDGRSLYLVQYLSPRDPTRYLVRLYDLQRRALLPEPIIDPREVGDVMRGEPVTRAASADGRWAYTLYAAPDHLFVHALDTVGRTARCIDLHHLSHADTLGFALAHEGRTLDVRRADGSVAATIDTETFDVLPLEETEDVAEPDAQGDSAQAEASDGARGGWALAALSVPGLALLGTGVALTRSRRRR